MHAEGQRLGMKASNKILLVDDDRKMLMVLEHYLSPMSFELCKASSGAEAFEIARRVQPDLIIMDAIMPDIDGFQLARMLKDDDDCCHIPLVMVTALSDLQDKIRALESGIHDFLSKPINKVELRARVRSVLKLKQEMDLLKKLNRIGTALSQELDLGRLLSLIVKEVRAFTKADAGSLYIRQGEVLNFEVAQNDTIDNRPGQTDNFKPFPLPLTRTSIAGYVALTGKVLNIEDVYLLDESSEFSFNRDFDTRNDYRSRSMLVTPMLDHRGQTIGVLQLINALNDAGEVIPFPEEVEGLVLSLASQAAVAVRNAQLLKSIKDIFAALVQYSASAIDARSPHTAGHSRRVASLSLHLARAVNNTKEGPLAEVQLSEEELEELSYAAWLHDIGKIGVREQVLEKTGKVSEPQMELIRARYQRIILLKKNQRLRELLEQAREAPGGSTPAAEIEAELERETAGLREELDFLARINIPGWLNDDDLVRLEQIRARTYLDEEGQAKPFLTEFEFENLSIRKGNLTEAEYTEIKSHVIHTQKIVAKIPFTPELARIPFFAAAHHEMLNGTGYPNGLQGEAIPLQARILGVADIFDALVARDRPYRNAIPVAKAEEILLEEAEKGRLDADLVRLFVSERIGYTESVGVARNSKRDNDLE